MDQRTVRSHLQILEIDNGGVFVDPERKEFCTREGIALLAKKLGVKGMAESEAGQEEQEPHSDTFR
jgi:hypothetical protein